jgi:predicted nucleic acid-binding protein
MLSSRRTIHKNGFILLAASEIHEKLRLSFWDSLVVASALCADCTVLYTEDLQHGLKIEEKLTVVNPFVEL